MSITQCSRPNVEIGGLNVANRGMVLAGFSSSRLSSSGMATSWSLSIDWLMSFSTNTTGTLKSIGGSVSTTPFGTEIGFYVACHVRFVRDAFDSKG